MEGPDGENGDTPCRVRDIPTLAMTLHSCDGDAPLLEMEAPIWWNGNSTPENGILLTFPSQDWRLPLSAWAFVFQMMDIEQAICYCTVQ